MIVEPARRFDVTVWRIFLAFLLVGATSFGGGVIGHVRRALVTRRRWLDDQTFLELLAISQTLPGLKGTNIAVLIGDRLLGSRGALAAMAGVCLPGAAMMYAVALVYTVEAQRPLVEAALTGGAAAAVGLSFATTVQLGRQSLHRLSDVVFILLVVFAVNRLHLPEPLVLIAVGALAIISYRPRRNTAKGRRL